MIIHEYYKLNASTVNIGDKFKYVYKYDNSVEIAGSMRQIQLTSFVEIHNYTKNSWCLIIVNLLLFHNNSPLKQ